MSASSQSYQSHAWLYDAAFDWDLGPEVEWLSERFGSRARSLLEPACGSARMFPEFAKRGIAVTGLDRSLAMLRRAKLRLSAEPAPLLVCADMTRFHLAAQFDGALCPISTFGYILSDHDAREHLACVARHLAPGGVYMVQVDLSNLARYTLTRSDTHSCWEVDHARGRIRVNVFGESWDVDRGIETMVMRYEIVDGELEGTVYEDRDPMRVWDWAAWSQLIAASPFEQVAAYDGSRRVGRPELELGVGLEGMRLTWHQLRLR